MFHHSFGADGKTFQVSAVLDSTDAGRGEVRAFIDISEFVDDDAKTHHLLVQASEETETVDVYARSERIASFPLDTPLPVDGEGVEQEDNDLFQMPFSTDFFNILTALDPITGCLAKGAATTAVAEIIRCWHSVGPRPTFGDRARDTANCLKGKGWRLAASFIQRVGICIVRLGL